VSRSNEWIKLLFKDKLFDVSGKGSDPISQGYVLKQNNPNPFTVSTQVSYNLPEEANVSIVVNNILGQQVLEIDRNNQDAGNHAITLDFSGKPDGIYFIALIADHKEVSKIKAINTH